MEGSLLRLSSPSRQNGKIELRDDLEAAIWMGEVGRSLEPRQGFIPSARNYILNKIDQGTKPGKFWDQLFFPEMHTTARYVIVLVVIIIFSIASGTVVLAGGRSLPGDRLFPLRRFNESISLLLTIDKGKKVELHKRLAQDYLVACAKLVSQGRSEDALEALRKYEMHISGTGRQLLEIAQSGKGDFHLLEFDFSRYYLQDLETLRVILPGVY